ncbi:MAG: UDP-N-acetylmuramate dehydrogenase [Atopobiaceae bacterium]|jgi:UDP-N-acetylmuramate dehydrogenase|nr:UDP-N-acetylmuramate dehydrogenase [Atopobiaceae bacterium]MCH4180300.1 UDP-N-acetylmuramate dehydrogenase [Atopobiaceae bacterium]MCH4214890.1 UDP-N-acetylmuramate dehydrogenase [Atopobiaceae bacterium]MCH4229327.1 UDP-N-acetylmuramate dehydrogenase [Atopobiaceae bacterium]MCH4276382.1 UDP-N-acetylmuramate dehydrogenase [Atopobiaceae bacterium]
MSGSSDGTYDRPTLAASLRRILDEDRVLVDEPMSDHTTFKVGGPADLLVMPDTAQEVAAVLAAANDAGAPSFVLGRGSDLLVSDAGYRGLIVSMPDEMDDVVVEGRTMRCQAGVTLADAAEMACDLGLTGLEFACGIPGTVGGAVFMNAGAYGGCIADVLSEVRVLNQEGHDFVVDIDDLAMGYRTSLVRTEGLVVLDATFDLEESEQDHIRATMDDLTRRREEKQPLELPSAGSTFKRPEGHYAGKLIMDAGLMGYQVGGAAVSTKHAGFVVNVDHATAADVAAVIAHVVDEVERTSGVTLEPEVRFLGDFSQEG